MAQLLVEYRDNTLCLTLNRPKRRNALSYSLLEDLHQALNGEIKSGCRAVVITGYGHCFSAGADLNELTGTVRDMEMDISISQVIDDIRNLSMTTVALIEGACIGGAVDIALACDVRIACDNAYLQVPATRLGLLYNPEAVARMSRIFSHGTLTRLFVAGERFSTADAIQAGLVTHVIGRQSTGIKPASKPDTGAGRASSETRDLLEALYNDGYDPAHWRAVYKDILASPERRKAITRAREKSVSCQTG